MKSRLVSLIAATALVITPLAPAAAKAPTNEVTLHIEASASVEPDMVAIQVRVNGNGADVDAAKANLDVNEQLTRKALVESGVEPGKITRLAEEPEFEAMMDPACAAAAAATAAASEAASEAPRSKRESAKIDSSPAYTEADCDTKVFANRTLVVELHDLSKMEAVAEIAPEAYNPGRNQVRFGQTDPAAAHRKAREQALANAREQADAMADAMGYKVIRVVRVSNAPPPITMGSLMDFLVTIDSRQSLRTQPSWLAGTVTEHVAIDYVMVPK